MSAAGVFGSLVGFALAFWLVTWVASALLGGVAWTRRRAVDDAAVSRTWAGIALALPPAVGAGVVLAIVGQSLAAHLSGAGDHCAPHGHHLHLCVVHGGLWAQEPAALALAAGAITFAAARLIAIGAAHVRAMRSLAALSRSGVQVSPDVVLVTSPRAFLFAAGLVRRRIYASTAAWSALGPEELAAALAHERAHLAGRDVARRFALSMAAVFGLPVLARRALARWDASTERLRDRDAAESVGDPMTVAGALVALARVNAGAPLREVVALAPGQELASRVESLAYDPPEVRRSAARRLGRAAAALLALGVASAAVFSDPLHHLLETILGVL